MKVFEKIVETFLWQSRWMVFFAAIASVVSAFILIVIGTLEVFQVIGEMFSFVYGSASMDSIYRHTIKNVITAVDIYLIATILLIFGVGLYELFISKISFIEEEDRSAGILRIHSLDQLKEKLAKVIVMILIVTFFKYAVEMSYGTVSDLMYLSGSIFLIAMAVFFMNFRKK